jgi:hypothetical protein
MVTLSTLLILNRADFSTRVTSVSEGQCNGRLPERGKMGRVVRSSWDHRRRTVGLRPLRPLHATGKRQYTCFSHDDGISSLVMDRASSALGTACAGPPSPLARLHPWPA